MFFSSIMVPVAVAIFFGYRNYEKRKKVGFENESERKKAIIKATFIGIGISMFITIVLGLLSFGACILAFNIV